MYLRPSWPSGSRILRSSRAQPPRQHASASVSRRSFHHDEAVAEEEANGTVDLVRRADVEPLDAIVGTQVVAQGHDLRIVVHPLRRCPRIGDAKASLVRKRVAVLVQRLVDGRSCAPPHRRVANHSEVIEFVRHGLCPSPRRAVVLKSVRRSQSSCRNLEHAFPRKARLRGLVDGGDSGPPTVTPPWGSRRDRGEARRIAGGGGAAPTGLALGNAPFGAREGETPSPQGPSHSGSRARRTQLAVLSCAPTLSYICRTIAGAAAPGERPKKHESQRNPAVRRAGAQNTEEG